MLASFLVIIYCNQNYSLFNCVFGLASALTNESDSSPASTPVTSVLVGSVVSCRRKEEPQIEQMPQPKKPRLVFTDLQRRTLQAIFKVCINISYLKKIKLFFYISLRKAIPRLPECLKILFFFDCKESLKTSGLMI